MKKLLTIFAGIAAGALLLWAAARQADLAQLAGIYARASITALVPVLFTVAGELLIRGYKWKLLLAPARAVKTWDAVRLETAALALNNLLPLRLGEIARGAYGAEFFGQPMAAVFATIAAEKALDFAALAALAAAVSAAGAMPGVDARMLALIITAAAGALFAARALLKSGRLSAWPQAGMLLAQFRLGLDSLAKPGRAALLCALALAQWWLNSLSYYFTAAALGLGAAVGYKESIAMSVTAAAASSIPGMPGYFGNVEYAVTALMKAWGVPAEAGLACAAAAHMAGFAIITAAGLACMYGMGRSVAGTWTAFSGMAGSGSSSNNDICQKSNI